MYKKFLSPFLLCLLICIMAAGNSPPTITAVADDGEKDVIRWVEFDVTYQALKDAMDLDIQTFEQDLHLNWVESLAFLGTKYGGSFSLYSRSDLDKLLEARQAGSSMDDLTKDMKLYPYFYKVYSTIFGSFLGMDKDGSYGLQAYSPVADGYWYNDSDDFGNGRSYGFARRHLGHDMFCSTGTPVAAVEGGKIEALGWNQYGGWRIGIRSHDGSRYYYYAHLRKDSPFAKGMKIGKTVEAGQIIGYTGQTGYSRKENVNNINVPHLHFGMQLIFDESQKECNSEIWVDVYALIRLLSSHKASPKEQAAPASAPSAPLSAQKPPASVQVPILMYHGLAENPSPSDKFYLSVRTFEDDMKYLKEHGYTAVFMKDLIRFVHDKTGRITLPEKPVVITFDDGQYNNFRYATPILKKYDMKAVNSLIGSACQESSDAEYVTKATCAVTWNQVGEMAASGLWEIQNHTYDLHHIRNGRRGAQKTAGESAETYEARLKKDLILVQKKVKAVAGEAPTTLTWPFGAYTEDSRDMLKSIGLKATLGCLAGVNTITKGDSEGLFLLRRNTRDGKTTIEDVLGIKKD